MANLGYIREATASMGDTRYGYIRNACFLIAIDNGGINRARGVNEWSLEYEAWISGLAEKDRLPPVNAWLASLSDEDLDTVCVGESTEAEEILQRDSCPRFTSTLLNRFFDEVC